MDNLNYGKTLQNQIAVTGLPWACFFIKPVWEFVSFSLRAIVPNVLQAELKATQRRDGNDTSGAFNVSVSGLYLAILFLFFRLPPMNYHRYHLSRLNNRRENKQGSVVGRMQGKCRVVDRGQGCIHRTSLHRPSIG